MHKSHDWCPGTVALNGRVGHELCDLGSTTRRDDRIIILVKCMILRVSIDPLVRNRGGSLEARFTNLFPVALASVSRGRPLDHATTPERVNRNRRSRGRSYAKP